MMTIVVIALTIQTIIIAHIHTISCMHASAVAVPPEHWFVRASDGSPWLL